MTMMTQIKKNMAMQDIVQLLTAMLPDFTPQLRQAATYILEHQQLVGISTIREISESAGVNPNSFMRLCHAIGFDGYESFREPFRNEIRKGGINFTDRAQWLQDSAHRGELGTLYANMVNSGLDNLNQTFRDITEQQLKDAADTIINARQIFVLGVGINYMLARNFAYLADMALDNVRVIPRAGSIATDDIARASAEDVLLTMTFKPYRCEILHAVEQAVSQKIPLIAISDSPASPIFSHAKHHFIVQSDTPQFFPSAVALTLLLETLIAFVVADADPKVIANIERFHAERHRLGIYCE